VKYCKKCDKLLSESEFYKNKNSSDGLDYSCKNCTKRYLYKWRENNPEKWKGIQNKWINNNIEKSKEISRECAKRYYQENKEKISIKNKVRNIKRRNIIHNFTYDEWLDKLEKTEGYCPSCKKFIGIYNLTLNHIIPISSVPIGTIYTINDVQPLCNSCNSSKNDCIKIRDDELNNIFLEKSYEEYIKEAKKMLKDIEKAYETKI